MSSPTTETVLGIRLNEPPPLKGNSFWHINQKTLQPTNNFSDQVPLPKPCVTTQKKMAVPLSSEFQQAVTDSKKLTQKPTSGDLLDMYCLYKQALQDPPFEDAEQPGVFDFKAKAKYKAWKEVVDKGITPEEAQAKYVALIGDMKEKYKYDPDTVPATVGGSS